MTFHDFCKIVSRIAHVPIERIKEHSSFQNDLGMDSLQMVNLLLEVSEQFPIKLGQVNSIQDLQTIGKMYKVFISTEENGHEYAI